MPIKRPRRRQIRGHNIFVCPVPLDNGVHILDVMRVFKVDHPATQFESGQRKGGHYACHGCKLNSDCALCTALCIPIHCEILSLQDRITKILKTVSSQNRLKRGSLKLYAHLDTPD